MQAFLVALKLAMMMLVLLLFDRTCLSGRRGQRAIMESY